jgi:cysteinyl-tRNA synthetase
MLTLAHHYRQSISYTETLLDEYKGIYFNILSKVKLLSLQLSYEGVRVEKNTHKELDFLEILSKDFDTPNAITKIYDIVKQMNKADNLIDKARLLNTFNTYVDILGIEFPIEILEEDIKIYTQWMEARRLKSFALADELRLKLAGKGYM